MTNQTLPERGDILTLTPDALAFGGKAVARLPIGDAPVVIFVDGALPGQTVRARVTAVKKRFLEAETEEILEPSPDQVDAPCPWFGQCGGCQWQNLSYEAQLRWKTSHVADALGRLGGFADVEVSPAVASPETLAYRNKTEFTFASGPKGGTVLGLHRRGGGILPVDRCLLQSDRANAALTAVREAVASAGHPAWDARRRRGFWRFLVIRESAATGRMMVNLITSPDPGYRSRPGKPKLAASADAHEAAARVLDAVERAVGAGQVTLVHSVRAHQAQVAFGERTASASGAGTFDERLGELSFVMSPNAFFQVNSAAAEKLYDVVRRFAGAASDDTLWDLYCGGGGIALWLAQDAGRIVGVDTGGESVESARSNAQANRLDNVEFHAGDAAHLVTARDGRLPRPDIVITDPPRAGMSAEVTEALRDFGPRRIVYVSCNPATQARDIGILGESYAIRAVQPVDLFPHTPHIESIVLLERFEETD